MIWQWYCYEKLVAGHNYCDLKKEQKVVYQYIKLIEDNLGLHEEEAIADADILQ